ncbi:glycoside hydrolase family 78 protein [Xylariaceae sp. FL1651]|nr:glycoside hydrolase family 78 protein [Xylariaceae sp. FL1651]
MATSVHLPLFSLITSLWGLTRHVSAQACWRDTLCLGIEEPVYSGEWDANNFAPASRNVIPSIVYDLASGQEIAAWPDTLTISSNQSGVYLDFGKEVGGIVTIEYTISSASGNGALGLAFSEAKDWVGRNSDSSNGNYQRPDGAIYSNFSSPGDYTYVMPLGNLRGGFRYMTLFLLSENASAKISNVSLELSFQPTWSNLRAYHGYFHSSDALLNRIWYSGAYTLQLNAINPTTGRARPFPTTAWLNNGLLGPGDTINVDGAKRDRTVWPGDMGVAGPASFYSTGDLKSLKNSLQTLYNNQADSGLLPFAGPPLNATGSDTYHMWTMIGLYNYVLFSGDVGFLRLNWDGYIRAMDFILSEIDHNVGLVNITNNANDWGRFNSSSYLAAAQMLAYRTMTTGATLAIWIGDTTDLNTTWLQIAANIKDSVNEKLWDPKVGAFKDNYGASDTGLHPQDGNSLAIVLGLVDGTGDQGQAISSWLTKNWTPIGPESPELPGEVSPFISSFEVQAHFLARQPQRALDLIRTSWGWYLNNENGTQSTMIEGYLTDGTFGYRHDAGYEENYSYTSHAHGWSTGPVTALSEHAMGLSITGLEGETCRFAPQLGDLTMVQGGFTTRLGKYFAVLQVNESTKCILIEVHVPDKACMQVILPPGGCKGNSTSGILVDSEKLDNSMIDFVDGSEGVKLISLQLPGGRHTIKY